MRKSALTSPRLARLTPLQRLGLGSAFAATGGIVIVLSLLLGWAELARPWSFIIGFAGGIMSGTGVVLAVCGLVHLARRPGSTGRGAAIRH